MEQARGAISGAKRAAMIRRVVEEVMSRRAGGESLPDARVIAEHASLMPELSRELSLLSILERARTSASGGGSSRIGERYDGPIQPLGDDAFEGYSVLGERHRGGQGVVYEAAQKSTGRRVAIKVMREGLFAGERDAARFEREVRILGQLEHPGVVSILASGIRGGHFYYVMDFIQGVPLDEYAASVGRDPRRVLAVFEHVCDAVNAAHLRGIIHRDLKPGNILVDATGQPHILDFGLARFSTDDPALRLTATGQFVGSMPWSSPEQAAGDQTRVDLRTDVYSLGVILYQALTGRFPYAVEGGPRDVLNNILTAAPSRMRSTSHRVDHDVEAIVLKCLGKERERRYQSAGEMLADLRRYMSSRPVLARTPSVGYQLRTFTRRNKLLVAAGATIVAALFLGIVGLTAGLIEASIARAGAVRERDVARLAQEAADTRRIEAEHHAYSASIAAADSALRAQDAAGASERLAAAPEHLRDWEWRYLSGRTDRSVSLLDSPPVYHALASPDGRRIAVLQSEGTLRVLDAATLATVWQTPIPREARDANEQIIPCFSPDGSLVVTGHAGRVLVWRIGADTPVADLSFPPATWGFVSAAIRSDHKVLVANGREGRMLAWDLESGRQIYEFPGYNRYGGVDFSPDGRFVAAATDPGPAVLFDGHTFERLAESPPGVSNAAGSMGGVRFGPDGTVIAASRGLDLVILTVPSLAVRTVLHGHTQRIDAWGFSADGQRLASAGWDRTVRVWNVADGHQERLYWGHTDRTSSAGFLADGRRVVSSSEDGTVRFWDLSTTGEPTTLPVGPTVYGLSLFPDNRRLLTTSFKCIKFWDRATPDAPLRSPVSVSFKGPQARAALSDDGLLLAAPSDSGQIELWDVDANRVLWSVDPRGTAPTYLCFSPDRRSLVTESPAGDTRMWNLADGSLGWSGQTTHAGNSGLAISPDSTICAVAMDHGVRLWDMKSGQSLADLSDRGPEAAYPWSPPCYCVAFSPDGTLLAAGDAAGCVRLWDVAARKLARRLSGMKPGVWSLGFNPTGTRLAAGSQDRMARIWDPRSGDELLVLRGHTGTVMTMAWSRDAQTLATGSVDGTVRIWNAPATQTRP